MSAQNREKLTPPLVPKMSALAQPPLSVRCGHTINFEKSDNLCTKKCKVRTFTSEEPLPLARKMFALDNPLPPDFGVRMSFMDDPLLMCRYLFTAPFHYNPTHFYRVFM